MVQTLRIACKHSADIQHVCIKLHVGMHNFFCVKYAKNLSVEFTLINQQRINNILVLSERHLYQDWLI